jgi:hypothetical protein
MCYRVLSLSIHFRQLYQYEYFSAVAATLAVLNVGSGNVLYDFFF